jgi:hypothetical protein
MPARYVLSWPFVQARWFTPTPKDTRRPVRVLVVHVMDAPEKGSTAEDVAEYFRTTERKASAHVCVDNNSVVRCVRDDDIAYAAPGATATGSRWSSRATRAQSADGWMDEYSMATLQEGARTGALYVKKYALPIRRLSVAELLAGDRGICGHDTVTAAYHQSDHTDPGPHFPWPEFLGMLKSRRGEVRVSESPRVPGNPNRSSVIASPTGSWNRVVSPAISTSCRSSPFGARNSLEERAAHADSVARAKTLEAVILRRDAAAMRARADSAEHRADSLAAIAATVRVDVAAKLARAAKTSARSRPH